MTTLYNYNITATIVCTVWEVKLSSQQKQLLNLMIYMIRAQSR